MTTIKQNEIDAVARAMAEEMRVGTDDVPERDVLAHRDDARRLIAGTRALAAVEPEKTPASPSPAEPGPTLTQG